MTLRALSRPPPSRPPLNSRQARQTLVPVTPSPQTTNSFKNRSRTSWTKATKPAVDMPSSAKRSGLWSWATFAVLVIAWLVGSSVAINHASSSGRKCKGQGPKRIVAGDTEVEERSDVDSTWHYEQSSEQKGQVKASSWSWQKTTTWYKQGSTTEPPPSSPDPAPSPSPSEEETGNSEQEPQDGLSLQRHNHWRSRYGASSLTWNEELASLSTDWASSQCGAELVHDDRDDDAGENIWRGSPSLLKDGNGAVEDWMDEADSYFENPDTGMTGHFTQAVWKASKELGCGTTTCGDGQIAMVCRYRPAGNVIGQYAENVGQLVN